jgi:hypothetical protein
MTLKIALLLYDFQELYRTVDLLPLYFESSNEETHVPPPVLLSLVDSSVCKENASDY